MGLRNSITRWRERSAQPPPAYQGTHTRPPRPLPGPPATPPLTAQPMPEEPVAAPSAERQIVEHPAEQPTAEQPAVAPRPQPGLVVGRVEPRVAAPALPAFYADPEPKPARAAAPYTDPSLLTKYHGFDRADLLDAWSLVSDRAGKLVETFYAELFLRLPEAPRMFPAGMARQRQDFGKAVVQWVLAESPADLLVHLEQLGADHRKFEVEPRHYEVAGGALVSAWRTLAGDAWTQRHEAAVIGSYTRLASIMIDGAMKNLSQPASWGAEVIEHHRILRDFAVLRLRPDAPYPYKPGQYLTLEIPAQRKLWRQMSIASAPRSDNTFDIHVRAIGVTGVSAGLVMHTTVGDRVKLGPPRGGGLVVEPGTTPSGLLCVGAGTGAAPISAVVESVLNWPEPTPLFAFLGGRTRADIYSVERLNELVQARRFAPDLARRIGVHGVVSDDPDYAGYRGSVENVVPRLADWAQLGVEVLVAGPDPMIAATVSNLTEVGVPRERIHFDQYELVA